MGTKSFAELMARLETTAEGQAANATVGFLVQVNLRMQALGMSNATLAQRMGTSRAYVTRLFRGSANLSVQSMVKMAMAVDAQVQLDLRPNGAARKAAGLLQSDVDIEPL